MDATRLPHETSLETQISIEKVVISAANDGASDLVKSFYDRDIRVDHFNAELRLFQSAKYIQRNVGDHLS